jgi:hypothetical protein
MVLCGQSGSWSPVQYSCTEVTCGIPSSVPDHSAGSITSSHVGSVASFSCESGYTLRGDSQITCQASGEWTTPLFTCVALSQPTIATTLQATAATAGVVSTSSPSECQTPKSASLLYSSTAGVEGGSRLQNGNDFNSRVFQLVELSPSTVSPSAFRCLCLSTCVSRASCAGVYISMTSSRYTCNGLSTIGSAVLFSTSTTESWVVSPSQCSQADFTFLVSVGDSVTAENLADVKSFALASMDILSAQYLQTKFVLLFCELHFI